MHFLRDNNINFAVKEMWKYIVKPQSLRYTYSQNANPNVLDIIWQIKKIIIDPNHISREFGLTIGQAQGLAAIFYSNDDNKLILYWDTVKNLIEKIQVALQFDGNNLEKQKLSYIPLISKLESKILHTYTSLYEILSRYPEGTKFSAVFHIESANGINYDIVIANLRITFFIHILIYISFFL